MKLKSTAQAPIARVQWHRRAVLFGHVAAGGDEQTVEAGRLWLCAPDGRRCYRNQSRPGGFFFFLDAPPGNYLLTRCDDENPSIGEREVVLPSPRKGKHHPLVHADLELVPPSSPGQPPGSPGPV